MAISTMGRSPAFSRYLRSRLDKELGGELELMIKLQEELRAELKVRVDDQERREDMLRLVINDERVWSLLSESYGAALDEARRLVAEAGE